MADRPHPIRIRIVAREQEGATRDPRDSFWAPLRESTQYSNASVSKMEAKLQREFGPNLRDALIEQFQAAFRAIDAEMFPASLRDFERLLFEYFGPMREREWMRYQLADAFTKLIEHRTQVLRETPSIRSAQERIATAAEVIFSARVVGYSSLELDLSVGSLEKLAATFDGHFDSFRVFLEAFVPVAFSEVFTEDFADTFTFAVNVPAPFEAAFAAANSTRSHGPASASAAASRSGSSSKDDARQRAEWLWKLANGSLLIPVLLALLVMFYGLRAISDIYRDHRDALSPIFKHQLELLEEDRHRLTSRSSHDVESNPAPESKDAIPRNDGAAGQ